MDDIEKALKEEQEEAKDSLAAMARLFETEGWKILSRVIAKQIRVREVEIVYGTDFSEALRGEARALSLVLKLPETIMQAAEETLNSDEENNDE